MMRAVVACGLALALAVPAWAHDAIGVDARKAYLAKLDELQRTARSSAPAPTRAQAWIDTGKTLDDIRTLLNEDIVSHGKPQGLETSILVKELATSPHRLVLSPHTRLYAADLRPYREALALDARGRASATARYLILKNHFYDSFTDHPLKPHAQSRETLQEMITFGEGLLGARDAGIDAEEVHFILAMHYLQAAETGALPRAKCQTRVAELVKKFRQQWPSSLKLATLEALAAP